MKYDPIKDTLARFARRFPFLRRFLYGFLGLMFLREWYVKRELRKLLRDGSVITVWDAGSGLGQYSYYCARRWPRLSILAVDVKQDQIEDCSAFFRRAGLSGIRFAVEDLTETSHSGEFDLILSVDVMEHIADDDAVFRNFARALRAGGRVLINTPSDLGGSDAHKAGDTGFIEEHARTGYGADEIRSKLSAAGLTIEKSLYTYGPWGSLAWRLGIKVPMLMLGASKVLALLLPFYYVPVLPLTLVLMWIDYRSINERGTGLLVIARKGS